MYGDKVFTDQNTKVLADGYKGTGEDGNHRPKPAQCEKVESVTGSCAGAGSEQFHIYRASRRRELDRLEEIEQTTAAEAASRSLIEKVEKNKKEAEERTKKNAEKRKKKMMKSRMRKKPRNEETPDDPTDEQYEHSSCEDIDKDTTPEES